MKRGADPDVPLAALTRRDFLRAAGAGVAVAAFPGCKPEWGPDWLGDGERVPAGPESWGTATCTFCPSLCGARVRVVGGKAVAVRGHAAHPKNAGALCPRGVAGLQHLYDLDRIVEPIARPRRDAPFERVPWDEALTLVAAKLDQARPALVLDGLRGLESDLAARLAGALGGGHAREGAQPNLAWDYERTRHAIFFGCEPLEDAPDLMDSLRALGRMRQGRPPAERGTIVVVGSRFGVSAARADEFVPVNPGSEAALALAMAGRMDREAAAGATGVPAATIARLRDEFFASSPQVAIGWRLDSAAARAVGWLNQQAGSLGKPGGLVPVEPPPFADWEAAPRPRRVDAPRAVVVAGANPAYRDAAFPRGAEFVVALSPILDETAALADVVLPTTTWTEQESVHTPLVAGRQVVAYSRPAEELRAVVDARPAGQVLIDLAQRIEGARPHFRWLSWGQALRERLVGIHDAQRGSVKERRFDEFLAALAREGVWTDERSAPAVPPVDEPAAWKPPAAGDGPLLQAFATTTLGEGEGASLPWMQESAGARHHLGWDTWIELHPSRGFATGEVVEVASPHGRARVRVVATEGIHPDAVAMPLGGGHDASGRWAEGRGANAWRLLGPGGARVRVSLRRIA